MTALEMKEEFLTRYDAATSLAAPGWEDSEISKFLNISQLEIVRELWINKSFELLHGLIDEHEDTPSTASVYSNYLYAIGLPEDFLYYIKSYSLLYIKGATTNPFNRIIPYLIENENISKAVSRQFITDANNRTIFRNPKAYITGVASSSALYTIISSIHIIERTIVEYVRKPIEIDIENETDTDLNIDLHDLVVDKAVKVALESIMQSKVQQQG